MEISHILVSKTEIIALENFFLGQGLGKEVLEEGNPLQGPKEGSCLTLGNDMSKETHMLTKQETLLEKVP